MSSTLQLILFAFVNYVPYMFLALLPFMSVLRLSKLKTAVVFSSLNIIIIFLFVYSSRYGNPYHYIATNIITVLCILFYFLTVKSRYGRMLFNLFMIKNTANFVVITGKYLEGKLFPDTCRIKYYWTYSLCMVIVISVIFPFIIKFIYKYFSKEIRDSINPKIWKYLWLIPLLFYIVWILVIYNIPSESSLEFALEGKSVVFMIIFLLLQYIVYSCIAKLVIHSIKSAILEEQNNHLLNQYIQYRSIQEHIHEITKIKHDIRHHLITINNYLDSKEYTILKEYLNNYINTLPTQKICYCTNMTLNMLLVYYDQKCSDEGILFSATTSIPDDMSMSDLDITVLFGNLLENAFESCVNVSHNVERVITFTGKVMQNQLVFLIENSTGASDAITYTDPIQSTKHAGNGIGTASIKEIVNKYAGSINSMVSSNIFSASIIIPISEK